MPQSLLDFDWSTPGSTGGGYSLMPQMQAPEGMVWSDEMGQWVPKGQDQQNNTMGFLKYLMSGNGGTGSLAGNLGTVAGRAIGYGAGGGAAGAGAGGGFLSFLGGL